MDFYSKNFQSTAIEWFFYKCCKFLNDFLQIMQIFSCIFAKYADENLYATTASIERSAFAFIIEFARHNGNDYDATICIPGAITGTTYIQSDSADQSGRTSRRNNQ